MRKVKKIFLVILKSLIFQLEHFSGNKYMKLYVPLLKKNGMNFTGIPRYIAPSVHFDGVDYSMITLGADVVISKNVEFLTHDFSIARGLQAINKKMTPAGKDEYFLKPIKVGDNTFIGLNSIIMPGCTIGNNVIIGSGSVVRGKIPDNSVVTGNPATVVEDTRKWAEHKYTKRQEIHCE